MPHKKRKRGRLIYLTTLCILASLVGFFFPFLGEAVGANEAVFFDPMALFFGGESSGFHNGYYYGFALSLNIPFLIFVMICIVTVFASLSARDTPRLLGATMFLLIVLIAGLALSQPAIAAINPSISSKGLVFGYGFYISILSMILGLCICLLELVLCIRFRRKRDVFR